MQKQRHTSEKTCLNQIPAAFGLINKVADRDLDGSAAFWSRHKNVLDFGGGRFDTFTKRLAELGVRNWVYDPFNRSFEHNAQVTACLTAMRADAVICSNVLNVIKEPALRQKALHLIWSMTHTATPVFITVHEGDGTSRGKKTSRGWQSNRPTKNYLREVRKVFPWATLVCGKLIVANAPMSR